VDKADYDQTECDKLDSDSDGYRKQDYCTFQWIWTGILFWL